MKKCRRIVVLGALVLMLGGVIFQNPRNDFGEEQYTLSADMLDERDVLNY